MKKLHVEGDPKLKNMGGKQYSMLIGRFQPWHSGHSWLVDQILNEGKNVLICVRDIEPDDKNPYSAKEVERNIMDQLWRLIGDQKVKVMIIPDIDSVSFGRGVGYDIIEYMPPKEVSDISASEIRKQNKGYDKSGTE